MATQYDDIGATYNELRKQLGARYTDYNFEVAAAPLVKGAKVLDLACGTGLKSNAMHSWGASRVVGVDISSAMIDVAKANTTSEDIQYLVADCSAPVLFDGGNFNVVLGSWLLNYASTRGEMINMYRTIAMNLKEGGTFLGVTPAPSEDPRAYNEKMAKERPFKTGQVTILPTYDVPDGVGTRIVSVHDFGNIDFSAYHLKKSVYETSAREAGLKGEITWKSPEPPSDELATDPAFLQSYLTIPHFGILVIPKN